MKFIFTNTRISSRWLISALLLIFTLCSQLAVSQATVTYSTEAVPGGSILQSTSNLLYILKVVVGPGSPVEFTGFSLTTTGTYTRNDVGVFNLLMGTDASIANATRIGANSDFRNGSGETVSWIYGTNMNRVIALEANSTTYFFVQVTTTSSAGGGRTIGINGAANSLDIGFIRPNPGPVVVNNQSDRAGLQTFAHSFVTYSTEALPAGNAYQKTDHVFYILKIETGSGDVTFDNLSIQITGNYTSEDIGQFKLWRSNVPSLNGSPHRSADVSVTGNGETLSFSGSQTLGAKTTTYFLVSAEVKIHAIAGHTFGINGASNALDIHYSIDPVVSDNQENASDLQTITAPMVVYATIPIGEKDALRGTKAHLLYVFQISTGNSPPLLFNNLTIRTNGTYSAADISTFRLFRSENSLMTPESIQTATVGSAVTGNGELVSFSGSQTLQPNTTTFFGVMADIAPDATPGRTFGIDGANSDLSITWDPTSHLPGILDNQTNSAGLQTVFAHSVTYSTIPLPAENVEKGASRKLVYLVKVVVGGVGVGSNVVKIKTTGTYTGSDITSFILLRSRSADMSPSSIEGGSLYISATGGGEVLSFNTPLSLFENRTYYFGLMAAVSPTATTGNTFGVDGSNKAVNFNFFNGASLINNVDNQTNVAGLKTIGFSGITYTTEPLPAGSALPGAVDQSVYALKVVMNGDAGATMTDLSVTTGGTYGAGDITSFSLYQSDTPTVNEGGRNERVTVAPIATINSPTGAGETLTFNTGGVSLPAGKATYLIIKANVASSGTLQRTFLINGQTNPATLYFSGISPSPITNNQTDAAGVQTIEGGLPVTLVLFDAKTEGRVNHLFWETSMEQDNDYFEIQRSSDAKNFSAIGQVKGFATGFQTRHYNYTDSETIASGGITYYRLKMVDLDKSYAYSSIVSVRIGSQQMPEVIVFPNPFLEYIKIKYIAGETVSLEWKAVDGHSVIAAEKRTIPPSGECLVTSLDALVPGIYLLTIRSATGQITQKVVKK